MGKLRFTEGVSLCKVTQWLPEPDPRIQGPFYSANNRTVNPHLGDESVSVRVGRFPRTHFLQIRQVTKIWKEAVICPRSHSSKSHRTTCKLGLLAFGPRAFPLQPPYFLTLDFLQFRQRQSAPSGWYASYPVGPKHSIPKAQDPTRARDVQEENTWEGRG